MREKCGLVVSELLEIPCAKPKSFYQLGGEFNCLIHVIFGKLVTQIVKYFVKISSVC